MLEFTHRDLKLSLGNHSATDPVLLATAVEKFRHRTQSGKVGFYDWPETIPAGLIDEISRLGEGLMARCQGVIIFGIGGSFLGGAAIQQALCAGAKSEKFPLYWVGNSDSGVIAGAESFLQNRKCAAIVISKSGNTTETMASFFHLAHHFTKENVVAITDAKSGELRRLATEQGWQTFSVPANIGGRYSVFTAVGLLPTYLMGVSPSGLLKGARQMRNELEASNMKSALEYAAAFARWDRQEKRPVHVLMGYRDGLKRTTEWFVQLWGESLGKKHPQGGAVGATPLSAIGTADQHSLLQLFKEGPADKVIGFLEVKEAAGEVTVKKPPFSPGSLEYCVGKTFSRLTNEALNAVEKSLNLSGVPTYRFSLPELSEETLGAFFFFQMTACALAGELYGVDAFDQPGVEEAKQLLKKALIS